MMGEWRRPKPASAGLGCQMRDQMTYKKSAKFTKRGNAVGFTSGGDVVHGCYLPKSRRWVVRFGERPSLCDVRNQSFNTEREASAYAASMLDEAKSKELCWW